MDDKEVNDFISEYKTIEFIIDDIDMFQFKKLFIKKTENEYICDGKPVYTFEESIPVKFAVKESYEIFDYLGNSWGFWNECPSHQVMKEQAKLWKELYGAEIIRIAHDVVGFKCDRKLNDAEVDGLLKEIETFAPNSMDIADYTEIKKKLQEKGIFTLWWD